MRKIVTLICLTISFCAFSQNKPSILANLTEVMLTKNYSASERMELNKYPLKLRELDYIYSKSFQVVEHQNYTQDQFDKININKYNLTRKVDEYVLVFDEISGLQLILFSLNKMDLDKKALMPSDVLHNDPTSKIAN